MKTRYAPCICIVLCVALKATVRAAPLTVAERATRLAQIRQGIAVSVANLDRQLAKPDAKPTVRDLTNAALAKLVLGQDPRDAEKLVRLAYTQQEMDPQSPRYGSLAWQIGRPEIVDENAIEFGTQAIGPLLLAYGDKLSPAFKQEMQPHIQAAFTAMRRRNFRTPAYTNIFLMRAVNMILLGEAVSDAKAAAGGYGQFDDWLAYTRVNGIHEFDSPTYYGVDLNCLGLGYRFAAQPAGHAKFKAALDLFWSDIAANTFMANGTLAGPHSRNYDFLHSAGGLNFYLYIEGLNATLPTDKPDLEKTHLLAAYDDKGYHPSADILNLAALPTRVVLSKWDTLPGADRYHYLTPDFSIGSASGNYGPQDKLLAIELASPKNLPVISVVPDIFDEPYGKLKTLDRSGHSKPTHLTLSPVAVQSQGTLLALLDLDPSKAPAGPGEPASLATNILLPAHADTVVVGGEPVATKAAFTKPLHVNSVVGIREGQSGVAMRIFRADGCAGQNPVFTLQADATGLRYGAARYTVYHYRGAVRKYDEKHVRVGILFMAAPCRDAAQFADLMERARTATISETSDAARWEVKAVAGGLMLEVGRDLTHRKVLYRRVNGQEMPTAVLSVNGMDLAARILSVTPVSWSG